MKIEGLPVIDVDESEEITVAVRAEAIVQTIAEDADGGIGRAFGPY